jgi:GTPase Era involved in 16S rRNA processing
MGHCGSGKSYLFNNLCGSNYATGYHKGSMTREIAFEHVCYTKKNLFTLYDTPGTNAEANTLVNATILRASLTALPLNLVLLNAALQNRTVNTIAEFIKQL